MAISNLWQGMPSIDSGEAAAVVRAHCEPLPSINAPQSFG